jgi:hypothetical protein
MIPRRTLASWLASILLGPAPATHAEPPRVDGEMAAHVSITVARDASGAAVVPGPFAVLPDARIAVYVAEADGILVLSGDRILHHYPIPSDGLGLDDMAASGTMLVAGRRPRHGGSHVDLFVLDLATGRMIQRVQSANPYLRPQGEGLDLWQVVVDGDLVGAFDPVTAASYPLWDRVKGPIPGSEQVVHATSGLGFGASAVWIPQPDGSLARKMRGRSEPFTGPEEGEFVGATADGMVVLLHGEGGGGAARSLPRDLVLRVLEAEHAISELRLAAVSDAVDVERRVLSGRPVRMHEGRLYWVHLGVDELEIRTTPLPERTGG